MCRAAVVAGAAVVLLGPAAGVASAAGGAAAGMGLAAGTWAVSRATWGPAEQVPGTAALNQSGHAEVNSVSCARAGTCTAGGFYDDGSGHEQAFVVSEVHGTWGTAEEVPGTAALNQGEGAAVSSVSCSSGGTCSAGGYYSDSSGRQAFVVSEVHGTWGTAEQVPGAAALNQGGYAEVNSVSCARAGTCTAGGSTLNSSGNFQAFVVSEVHGTWGMAEEIPGTANQDWSSSVDSVSCATAGTCSAGGSYNDDNGLGDFQAFVVSEVHGTWGTAEEVPGTAALNQGGYASVSSVSCATAGTCTAGGDYTGSAFAGEVFVVSEMHGTWRTAEEIPGTAALNQGNSALVFSVSCARAGACAAGGQSDGGPGIGQAFVVSEMHGTWHTAEEVPGLTALNQGDNATVYSVSCSSASTCSAGGEYTDSSGHEQAFVVSEVQGTWGTAEEVPGTAALNQGGGATVNSVSCAPAGTCTAGGYYAHTSGHEQAFVVSEVPCPAGTSRSARTRR
jgi:hypothetical protein